MFKIYTYMFENRAKNEERQRALYETKTSYLSVKTYKS